MELKFGFLRLKSSKVSGSNRTFMELKSSTKHESKLEMLCSNRTFMELKLVDHEQRTDEQQVLIVPLWN